MREKTTVYRKEIQVSVFDECPTQEKPMMISYSAYVKKYPFMLDHVHKILRKMPLPFTFENLHKADEWLEKKRKELSVDKSKTM
jgi:hypothetical protein